MSHLPRHRRRPPDYMSRHQQGRLLLLVLLLGGTVLLANQIRRPSGLAFLRGLLGEAPPDAGEDRPGDDAQQITAEELASLARDARETTLPADVFRAPGDRVTMVEGEGGVRAPVASALLDEIKDNTPFRSGESAAWFALLEVLQATPDAKIDAAALGSVSYIQLLRQPQRFRGRVVSIRGAVRQVLRKTPAANDLGLQAYYRLVIRPEGGNWPIVVFCLELPEGFPRREPVDEPAQVSGYFFKNWSYPQEEGLGIAPVLLAKSLKWQPEKETNGPRGSATLPSVLATLLGAAAVATLTIAYLWRRSRGGHASTSELPERIELPSLEK